MDRYEKVSQLSNDVLGDVYLAQDTMLTRQVIVRHIEHSEDDSDQSWKEKFSQYAGRLSSLRHPNLPTIYDLSCQDNGANIVSQYLEGETLSDRLIGGPLRQTGVHTLASDLLDVLHAAHEIEVYHGGLHMASILRINRVSGGFRNVITDLGLNKLVSMVRGEKVKTIDPVLMAPELFEKGSEADAKADLYMLGQICYTSLIGGHPYSAKSEEECIAAYQNEQLPPLENYVVDMDPTFSQWVMKMVEVDPANRFEDAAEAMMALNSIQLTDPVSDVGSYLRYGT